jgi:gamma-glutamylaminecyclotransferase
MISQVFVYGTLKRGQRNHHYLVQAEFVGDHLSEECFSMYQFDDYPAVTENGSHAVSGEIYRVNRLGFEMLDELEGYPRFYQRIEIATDYGCAWMYIVKPDLCRDKLLLAGTWPPESGMSSQDL